MSEPEIIATYIRHVNFIYESNIKKYPAVTYQTIVESTSRSACADMTCVLTTTKLMQHWKSFPRQVTVCLLA